VDLRVVEELISKGRRLLGAKFRLHDIEVEEVSLVDRAANRRKFIVVKRGVNMPDTIDTGNDSLREELLQPLSNSLGKLITVVDTMKKSDTPVVSGLPGIQEVVLELTKAVEMFPREPDSPLSRLLREATESSLALVKPSVGETPSQESVDFVKSLIENLNVMVPPPPPPVKEEKAEGVLSTTLREVSETSLSLAQSVAESEELNPSILASVKAIVSKLMSVIEKYPSPVTQDESSEKSVETEKEMVPEATPSTTSSESVSEHASVELSNLGTETADKLAVLGHAMNAIAEAEDPDSLRALRDRILGVAKAFVELKGSSDVIAKIEKVAELVRVPAVKEPTQKSDSSSELDQRITELEEKYKQIMTTPQTPASRPETTTPVPNQRQQSTISSRRRRGGTWVI